MEESVGLSWGGETWRLDFPQAWQGRIEAVYGHLLVPVPEAGVTAQRIRFRREASVQDRDVWQRLRNGVGSEDTVAVQRSPEGCVAASQIALYRSDGRVRDGDVVLLDPAAEPVLLGANLLINHLGWRSAERGLFPLHAAAVGDPSGAFVLLPGGAGRGKSTAAMVAAQVGLRLLGDDFLLWDSRKDVLHSLYQTLRLDHASLELVNRSFPLPQRAWVELDRRDDGKSILVPDPNTQGGSVFLRQGTLAGVVLLNEDLDRGGETRGAASTLRAFASTLAFYPPWGIDRRAAFAAMVRISRQLPCMSLPRQSDLTEFGAKLTAAVESLISNRG